MTEIRTLREKRQFRELSLAEQADQLETRFRVWLREREQEKLLVFFLTNGQNVVLAKAPSDKNAEKVFLGYEFSNRKGSEGLKILSGTHTIETALYSETNESDPNKINTLIRQNFLGEKVNVPQALADYVVVAPLLDLMTFDQVFALIVRESHQILCWRLWPLLGFLRLKAWQMVRADKSNSPWR